MSLKNNTKKKDKKFILSFVRAARSARTERAQVPFGLGEVRKKKFQGFV